MASIECFLRFLFLSQEQVNIKFDTQNVVTASTRCATIKVCMHKTKQFVCLFINFYYVISLKELHQLTLDNFLLRRKPFVSQKNFRIFYVYRKITFCTMISGNSSL